MNAGPFPPPAVFSFWPQYVRYAPPPPRPTMTSVLGWVCAKHGIEPRAVIGRNAHAQVSRARQEFMAEAYRIGRSMPQIGAFLDGRDHSTISAGIRRHRTRAGGRG